MSTTATSWVWRHSEAVDTDRLVLLAIADAADADGDNSWPKIETIAAYVRKSERTVRRSLRSLQELGELEIEFRAGGKRDVARNDLRPNLYRLTKMLHRPDTGDPSGKPTDRTQLRPVTCDPSLENDRTSETERPDTPGSKTTGHCCPKNKTMNVLIERGDEFEEAVDNPAAFPSRMAELREAIQPREAVGQ